MEDSSSVLCTSCAGYSARDVDRYLLLVIKVMFLKATLHLILEGSLINLNGEALQK